MSRTALIDLIVSVALEVASRRGAAGIERLVLLLLSRAATRDRSEGGAGVCLTRGAGTAAGAAVAAVAVAAGDEVMPPPLWRPKLSSKSMPPAVERPG